MTFVWRGGGILTLIILFSGALIAHSLFPDNRLALAAAFSIGALVNWIIGATLNRQLRNAGVEPLKRHWLFLVPMEWWSLAFLAAAAAVAGRALRIGLIATLSIAMSLCALLPSSADARDCQWKVDGGSIAILAQREMDGATIFAFEIQPIISRNVTFTYRFSVPIGENDFRFFLQTSSPHVRYSVAFLNRAGKAVGREIGAADYSYKAIKPETLTLVVKVLLPFREWIALGSLRDCTDLRTHLMRSGQIGTELLVGSSE